jgi:intracellular multiplication protein IcmV
MGLWRSTKKTSIKLLDFRIDKWMSLEQAKDTWYRTKLLIQGLIIPQKSSRIETFEQAMQRLALTENDLQQRQREFTRLCYIFLCMGITVIIYAGYMISQTHHVSALISFCLALYAFSQAFRFHFWLFQVRNRKLGCTINEWLNSKIVTPPSCLSSDLEDNP